MENVKQRYDLLTCYHCGNVTLMEQVASHTHKEQEIFDYDDTGDPVDWLTWESTWKMFKCPVCHDITVQKIAGCDRNPDYETEIIYPGSSMKSHSMPDRVFAAFDAAMKVRNIDGAICALSLRRTLEMMCKDKGELTKETLWL